MTNNRKGTLMATEEAIEDIVFDEDELTGGDIPEEDQGTFDPRGGRVRSSLQRMTPDTPETRRAGKKEALRIMLTDAMRKARKQAGKTQQDVADRLEVSQGWVSKLESPNYDHQIESVLDHLDALGAELRLTIETGQGTTIPVNYKELAGEGAVRYTPGGAKDIPNMINQYAPRRTTYRQAT